MQATVSSSNETYLIYKIAEVFPAMIFRKTGIPLCNQQYYSGLLTEWNKVIACVL